MTVSVPQHCGGAGRPDLRVEEHSKKEEREEKEEKEEEQQGWAGAEV